MDIDTLKDVPLRLEISSCPESQLSEFLELLLLLPKQIAKLFLDKFLRLLDGACLEFVEPCGLSTGVAGYQVARLRILGMDELIAAARSTL